MAKIALNITRASNREIVAKSQNVQTKMTGNAAVTEPNPALTVMKTNSDAALAAVQLVEQLELDLATARANRDALVEVAVEDLQQQASTVESVTRGDATQMISCGFDVASAPSAVQPMGKVENNVVTTGDDAGTGDGMFDAMPYAKSYEVQISPDPMTETSWKHYLTTTESKYKIAGQTSGAKVWTRVRAVNRKGPGPWSDPACAMIP